MTSTYTTNKNIEKPGYNDYASNPTGWSGPINTDWDIIDAAFGGFVIKNPTGLSGTQALAVGEYQKLIIIIGTSLTGTATLTANITYTIPVGVGGNWIVYNNTTGAFTVTFAVASGGGTSVVLGQGTRTLLFSDGTNVNVVSAIPLNDSITAAMLQTDSVTTPKIQNGAVTLPKIASSAQATSAEYVAGNLTATFNGSIGGTTLSVTSITAGNSIVVGMTLSSAGAGFVAGTTITALLSGSGGAGSTYSVSATQTVSTTSFTGTTSNKLIPVFSAWDSTAVVALTDAAQITPDFARGYNFSVTIADNRQLMNPSNPKLGQSGLILVTEGTPAVTNFTATINNTAGTPAAGTTLTVSAVSSGTLAIGTVITSGAAAGTTITAFGTGSGTVGTYTVNTSQLVSSTAMVGSTGRTLTYDTAYKFPGGVAPTFDTTAGRLNILTYSVYSVSPLSIVVSCLSGVR
jgi:hypothetical protein